MNMRKSAAIALLLVAGAAFAQEGRFTDWESSSQLTQKLNEMKDDRMFPGTVEGQTNGDTIQYRAEFIPFLKDMNLFQTRWGMTDVWYQKITEALVNCGYREYAHSVFYDQVGNKIHQATWVQTGSQIPEPGCSRR